jgi:hypothetical protein
MAWPKGRSRKPQQQPEQQQPAAGAEVANKGDEPKPEASKVVSKSKAQQAKASKAQDAPRAKWRLPKEVTLAERAKAVSRDVEWRDRSGDDLLALPEEAHQWLRDQHLVAQWIATSVLGQEQRRHVAQMQANGWEPVQPGEIPGVDEVEIDGNLRLHVRSATIHKKALKAQDDAAKEPMRNRQQMLIEGVPGVTGSDHITARNYNQIKKHVERITVPQDD